MPKFLCTECNQPATLDGGFLTCDECVINASLQPRQAMANVINHALYNQEHPQTSPYDREELSEYLAAMLFERGYRRQP